MDMLQMVQSGLLFGAILSVVMAVFVFGGLRLNNEMWLDDYPPDVRAAWGPMSARARRLKRWAGLIFMVVMVSLVALQVRQLVQLAGGFNYWGVTLGLWISLMLFNLVDLVVFDWLILMVLRPSFAMLPGTEGLKGYTDFMFPFVGFLKGTVGISLASPILAAIAYAFYALLA